MMTGGRWSEYDEDGVKLEPEERAALFGLDRLPERRIDREAFMAQWKPRRGAANPERAEIPFWFEQMRTFHNGWWGAKRCAPHGPDLPCDIPFEEASAWIAANELPDELPLRSTHPVWSFDRFGRSVTELADGRLVLIAGEHEDHYDPDFCIYADVTVIARQAEGPPQVDHFLYPEADFPPTDFHSATLVGDAIWIIGSLGYPGDRRFGSTQVLRLDLKDFSVRPVEVPGPCPGWISEHEAELVDGRIIVSGGKICRDPRSYEDFEETWAFDPAALRWDRLD